MKNEEGVLVKSHVARDLLQNAALFKTDKLVVWEYVSNGLQYVDPGVNPIVKVKIDSKSKSISIIDNGRGMDWSDLNNFFVMHGENIDRKSGRAGRGRFGTGKSAAFGIADTLSITTVKNGKLSRVELKRSEIENILSGEPVPVKTIQKEITTDRPNGTIINIDRIYLRSLDQAGIIKYIERHLSRWPRNVSVFVNNHECEYYEPAISEIFKYRPNEGLRDILGDLELVIKVSKVPLDQDFKGISIYSNGVWYETTLAGNETRDMSQYIFGEIEVYKLDDESSPIPAFDMSRSMKLNPNNPLVSALYSFIGENVEIVRRNLVNQDKKRRQEEEAKRLAKEAEEISKIINEDFIDFRNKLAKVTAQNVGGSDYINKINKLGDNKDAFICGNEFPAEILSTEEHINQSNGKIINVDTKTINPKVTPANEKSEHKGEYAEIKNNKHVQRGGFQVDFEYMGEESDRAQYVSEKRTIYINLDHPQLKAAKGNYTIEDTSFKRLTYEIAFAEYSIALASELANNDNYIDPTDPIYDIRTTLNRIVRRAAFLYT